MNQSLRFDKKDRDLLRKINEVIDSGNVSSAEQETFRTALHPHGIQNMVSTHEERMAMAEVNLLQRLNDGTGVEERLSALKTLHDEVLYSAQTPFRFNTSRVLIQLMKEIVRARGNEEEQLRLIHDFQKVAAGNPRIVRAFLSVGDAGRVESENDGRPCARRQYHGPKKSDLFGDGRSCERNSPSDGCLLQLC